MAQILMLLMGDNYFDHDPGLDMDTYKLKDDSFSLGKGIDTSLTIIHQPLFSL
jgi:hypothetical protein